MPRLLDHRGRPLPRQRKQLPPEEIARRKTIAGTKDTARVLTEKMEPGDWIGCYECVALDSVYIGERMLLVFGADQYDAAKIGSPAPDTNSFGLGWKFRLVEKQRDINSAAQWLHRLSENL